MPKAWDSIAEDSKDYQVTDFQKAGYQLVCAQILYESNSHQRVAYRLIREYQTQFREAVALFGLDLFVDDMYRYCAAIPRAQHRVALPLDDTLLVLVLRKLYHEQASKGALTDEGSAVVSIEELHSAYNATTHKELPSTRRDLGALLDQMKRFGIAKEAKETESADQPFDVEILPGITRVVNEDTLMKLSAHYESATHLEKLRQSRTQQSVDGTSAEGSGHEAT